MKEMNETCKACGSKNLDRDGDCLSCGQAFDEPVMWGMSREPGCTYVIYPVEQERRSDDND